MTNDRIEYAATELARLMAGAQDDDAGNFGHYFDDEWSEGNWDAICDRADQLRPTIVVTEEERASWARANTDFRAEQRAERIAFGGE